MAQTKNFMNTTKIGVEATIKADKKKVWEYYTKPSHIMKWNFADPSWHCPKAENDLRVGGISNVRMEAKDGSFGFDFKTVYKAIVLEESFTYEMEDGRIASVELIPASAVMTIVKVVFDPENENPIELQKDGWQAILNNFKNYTENNQKIDLNVF